MSAGGTYRSRVTAAVNIAEVRAQQCRLAARWLCSVTWAGLHLPNSCTARKMQHTRTEAAAHTEAHHRVILALEDPHTGQASGPETALLALHVACTPTLSAARLTTVPQCFMFY